MAPRMASSQTLLAIALLAWTAAASTNTSLEHQHLAHSDKGEDYIVRGQNLKKLEDKLGGVRNFLRGRRKPLKSYPWVATLLLAQIQLIYEHTAGFTAGHTNNWPDKADKQDLIEKFKLTRGQCSGVLILPKVLLTADHCFWGKRMKLAQYWKSPDATKPNEYRLYKSADVQSKRYVSGRF